MNPLIDNRQAARLRRFGEALAALTVAVESVDLDGLRVAEGVARCQRHAKAADAAAEIIRAIEAWRAEARWDRG